MTFSVNPLGPVNTSSSVPEKKAVTQPSGPTYINKETGLIAPIFNEKFRAARVKDKDPPLLPEKKV